MLELLAYLAPIVIILTWEFTHENREFRKKERLEEQVKQMLDAGKKYLHEHRN